MRTEYRTMPAAFLAACVMLACGCGDAQEPKKKSQDAPAEKTEKKDEAPAKVKPPAVEDKEEGSFTVKIPLKTDDEAADDQPAVKVDHSNVFKTEKRATADVGTDDAAKKAGKKSWVKETPMPAECLAATVGQSSKYDWKWSPRWSFKGLGGVRVPDVALSTDSSLFAFAEITGETDGPFGSRIILLNTHSWKVEKVIEFPGRKIDSLAFIPGTTQVAAACDRQAELKQPYGISVIDLVRGKEMSFTQAKARAGSSFIVSKSGTAYMTSAEDSQIYAFSLKNPGSQPKAIQSGNSRPVITLSEDENQLAVAGDTTLDTYKTSDLRLLSSWPLPSGFQTETLIFMPEKDSFALAPQLLNSTSAITFKGGSAKQFGEKSSGILMRDPTDGTLYGVMRSKSRIVQFRPPAMEEVSGTLPEEIRPKTSGDPVAAFMLPHAKCIAMLDKGGNFYLVAKNPGDQKRWQKDLIFTPVK